MAVYRVAESVHYNHKLNPPISLDPQKNEELWGAWRWYKETGGGYMTDFGAHNFDIAQWALKKEKSGPVEIIPAGHNGFEHITYRYDDGITMINAPFTEDETYGVKLWGKDAWFEVTRGHVAASDPSLLPQENEQREGGTAPPHIVNFVDAVRNRTDPIAPVEDGHRSASVGTLGNIATFLNRPLQWDPHKERFLNDSEADQYLHREYRSGYQLM